MGSVYRQYLPLNIFTIEIVVATAYMYMCACITQSEGCMGTYSRLQLADSNFFKSLTLGSRIRLMPCIDTNDDFTNERSCII